MQLFCYIRVVLDHFLRKLVALLKLCEAVAAIYRTIGFGLKRNSCFFTALSANSCEILSGATSCVFASVTAGLAALGLILETALCVKFLLTCSKYELFTAFFAN